VSAVIGKSSIQNAAQQEGIARPPEEGTLSPARQIAGLIFHRTTRRLVCRACLEKSVLWILNLLFTVASQEGSGDQLGSSRQITNVLALCYLNAF
jgi:hypothetical protein